MDILGTMDFESAQAFPDLARIQKLRRAKEAAAPKPTTSTSSSSSSSSSSSEELGGQPRSEGEAGSVPDEEEIEGAEEGDSR